MDKLECLKTCAIGQSAAKPRIEERSTTIPEGSRGNPKQVTYLKIRNVIYSITNTTNNKRYIGSASYYDKRLGTHVSKLNRGIHWNKHLQNAWNKSKESFIFEILEREVITLDEREQYWIDFYKSCDRLFGYNLACNAINKNKGIKRSDEFKANLSLKFKGRKLSNEQVEIMKRKATETYGVKIKIYTKDFKLVGRFASLSEASRFSKISIAAIKKQCKKEVVKKPKSFIFKYDDMV